MKKASQKQVSKTGEKQASKTPVRQAATGKIISCQEQIILRISWDQTIASMGRIDPVDRCYYILTGTAE